MDSPEEYGVFVTTALRTRHRTRNLAHQHLLPDAWQCTKMLLVPEFAQRQGNCRRADHIDRLQPVRDVSPDKDQLFMLPQRRIGRWPASAALLVIVAGPLLLGSSCGQPVTGVD